MLSNSAEVASYIASRPDLQPSPPPSGPKPFVTTRGFSVDILRAIPADIPKSKNVIYFYEIQVTARGCFYDAEGNPTSEETRVWTVVKRFSEFIAFHETLVKYCSGLPPAPEKAIFYNSSMDALVAKRQVELKDMLSKMLDIPFIPPTATFSDFFRVNDYVQLDRRNFPQVLQNLQHPTPEYGFNQVLYDVVTGVLLGVSEKVNVSGKLSTGFSSLKSLWSGAPKSINADGNIAPNNNTTGMLVCYVYSTSAQEWKCMYKRHFDAYVTAIAWNLPERHVYLAFSNGQICFYQAAPGFNELSLIKSTHVDKSRIDSLVYIPEKDALVSTSRDSQLCIQRASGADTQILAQLAVKEGRLTCTYDAQNEYLFLGSGSSKLLVYNISNLEKPTLVHILCGHNDVIRSVYHCASSGYVVTGGFDATCGIWTTNATTGVAEKAGVSKRTQVVGWLKQGCKSSIKSVVICPEVNTVATGYDNGVIGLWDTQSGTLSFILNEHTSSVVSLLWLASSNLLVSAGRDGKVSFYHVYPQS